MKTKTNQEIMAEFQTRGRFRTPEEVDQFFLEALQAKDEQHKKGIEKVFAHMNHVIATDKMVFNKENAQASLHAINLFHDKLTKLKNET